MLLTMKHLLLALLAAIGGFALIAYARDQSGFINMDCGLEQNSTYSEKYTGLYFVSDASFIDGGEIHWVQAESQSEFRQALMSLRSFPKGIRNCYRINIKSGTKYLIKAYFLYKNYDGKNTPPNFELHLGANLWDTITFNISYDADAFTTKEIIHVSPRDYINLCLVKTGSSIPFISAILVRPLDNTSYQTPQYQHQPVSLDLVYRIDAGTEESGYRYPKDVHDRYWESIDTGDWTNLNTSVGFDTEDDNEYQLPYEVMCTAATPKYAGDSLTFTLPNNSTFKYYFYMHFAELQELGLLKREFKISYNGNDYSNDPLSLNYLTAETVASPEALVGGDIISIDQTEDSDLPPIINAYELYMVKDFPQLEAEQSDSDAMAIVKSNYGVKRSTWQGDPCTSGYVWEGLNCSYVFNESPRIIYLNLSSSGLTGEIPPSISSLTMIQILDLSNNSFSGSVPIFLSLLPNLRVLNLEKNYLTGSVPVELIRKWKQNVLSLSVGGNQNLIIPPVSLKAKNNFVIPVVASVVGIFVILLTVAAMCCGLKRKRHHQNTAKSTIHQNKPFESNKQQYKYSEIQTITNNFATVLGQGGFGNVYHGQIGKTQVAVKMLSPSTAQGHQQFLAEVKVLMRVHHVNLTKLVGYCNDGPNTGLIYEYMANGDLHSHLSGKRPCILKWKIRLEIALQAAQGLEYLHHGCNPSIIHRDVKSKNILLNENLQAKLSDFGLSKTPTTDSGTGFHTSSVTGGTPGYLDPEFTLSNRRDEKSDVYSFGVVLLEIITGRPVISNGIHISQWVTSVLENGDIKSIVDRKLDGEFDINSAWKAVELAVNCVSHNSTQRPIMSQVAIELKDCLCKGLD